VPTLRRIPAALLPACRARRSAARRAVRLQPRAGPEARSLAGRRSLRSDRGNAAEATAARARATKPALPPSDPRSLLLVLLRIGRILDEQHLEDLVLALPSRSADAHRVADLAADQPARDGARDADAALLQIR